MTQNITLLHDVRPLKEPTRVKLGDGRYIQAVSRGDLHSCINIDGKALELFFPNVLHVPKLGQNLLSAHLILKNGYSITGNSHGFIIRSDYDQKPLLIGRSKGSLYFVPIIVKLPSTVENKTDLIVETALPSVVSTDTQVGKIPSEGTKEEESKIKPLLLKMDEAHLHFGHW